MLGTRVIEELLALPYRDETVPPDIAKLRAALQQRAAEWTADLRADPRIARMVLRQLGRVTDLAGRLGTARFCEMGGATDDRITRGSCPHSRGFVPRGNLSLFRRMPMGVHHGLLDSPLSKMVVRAPQSRRVSN